MSDELTNFQLTSQSNPLSLREIQLAELHVLNVFAAYCEKNGLSFSLCGGTALGAVRHQGFIPWDDDIDLAMARPDYERFIGQKERFEAATGLLMRPSLNCEFGTEAFVKVEDPSIVVKEEFRDEYSNLWLDVIPVDGLPDDAAKIKRIYKKSTKLMRILSFFGTDISATKSPVKRLAKELVSPVRRSRRFKEAVSKELRNLATSTPYGSTHTVGVVTWGRYGAGEAMPFSGFEEKTLIAFEGERLPIMACWDQYLTGIYGDYHVIPPHDEREDHGIRAYRVEG